MLLSYHTLKKSQVPELKYSQFNSKKIAADSAGKSAGLQLRKG
jgi:hypothetical protein